MAYRMDAIPMTFSYVQGYLLLQAFYMFFRTAMQQFTNVQLTAHRAVPVR